MKVSLSWLKEYVSFDATAPVLADALTMAGLEVDSVADRYEYLAGVVVGRISAVEKHPNADTLKLCTVQLAGDVTARVVCGAPNARAGMLAPLALPDAVMADGTVIKTSVIRGEPSHGMLCSEFELGLGTDRSGLMVLAPTCVVGAPLVEALGLSDPVLDIDLTPNRPDCLSMIGTAREVAAFRQAPVRYPDTTVHDKSDTIATLSSVTIEAPDDCPRYAARIVEGIKIGPSPFWLQDRLISVGLRPINNIVDITNFVMMETGQPLHAFDLDHLAENRIVVRRADAGEAFTTLDGKDRILSAEMLMICDAHKPVAIAGVMGGLNSEVAASTTRVLIESACFDPVSIRKTAKKLGLNTDAAHRFERGVDPDGTIAALNRAALLMADIGNGHLIDGLIDEHPKPSTARCLDLSIEATNRRLGTRLTGPQIADLLGAIEFTAENKGPDTLTITAPTFRVDITRPVDLMEEVARLWGYNKIPTTNPMIPSEARQQDPRQLDLRYRIKDLLVGLGFREAINYSFISSTSCDRLRLDPKDRRRQQVEILNPLTEDQAVMRTTLIPGLLEVMHRNIARQEKTLRVFETGTTFLSQGKDTQPKESEGLAVLWTGNRRPPAWHSPAVACDFYDIKGVTEALLHGLNIRGGPLFRPAGRAVHLHLPRPDRRDPDQGESCGLTGQVHPQVLAAYDLKQPAFVLELNIAVLAAHAADTIRASAIPRFPATTRDMTLIFDMALESASILAHVADLKEPLLEDIQLFDVYDGKPIAAGKKSISFRLVYRSTVETLEDERVNRLHKNITEKTADPL